MQMLNRIARKASSAGRLRRPRRSFGIALTLAAAVAGAGAPAASAGDWFPSMGCTATGGGHVCLGIAGGKGEVSRFRVFRTHLKHQICGYQARVRVYQPTRGTLTYYSAKRGGCAGGWAAESINPGVVFEHNSKACGAWFEFGRWLSGTPCNRILHH